MQQNIGGGSMKRYIPLLLIIALFSFNGCSRGSKVSFMANVLENNQTSILVEPLKDSNEIKSSDKISVSVVDTVLLNNKGEKIGISGIEAGKQVKITYNGQIAESYPAQIHKCYKIQLID